MRVEDHEADDAIGTLANRATEPGFDAVIVTADRDFFQLVRDRREGTAAGSVAVLFNRRGISDIDLMDEAAVEERFGVPPSKYLDYVALKGDPRTTSRASRAWETRPRPSSSRPYGSVEELLAQADAELKGKQQRATSWRPPTASP